MDLFSGEQYLKIDIANNFGEELDKHNWEERIAWFDMNEHQLEALIPKAENMPLFAAGIAAWKKFKNNEPSGYPISLDATASGIQILSLLTGDRKAASICNVVNTGKREDAYTSVYEEMLKITGGNSNITRKDLKDGVMTSTYGSQAIPKMVFGTGKLLDQFHQTMEENLPGVWEFNKIALSVWDKNWTQYGWVMPDNFHVICKVMSKQKTRIHFDEAPYDVIQMVNAPEESGRAIGANITHSVDGYIVREMARRCMFNVPNVVRTSMALQMYTEGDEALEDDDYGMVKILWEHYQKTGILSARILDYIKPTNVMLVNHDLIWEMIHSLPEKPFNILMVHD